jgi:N-acetylmuramoyl-L-alanine amidase
VIDGAERDGRFGPPTQAAVRWVHERRHRPGGRRVGAAPGAPRVAAGWGLGDRTLYHRAPMFRGDDVRELQRKLNALGFDAGKEDGLYGPRTDGALRQFQRNVGDDPDGIVGPHTLAVLGRMRPLDEAPSRALVREREQLADPRGPIEGCVIAIDVGDGPQTGSDVHLRVARALAAELVDAGADARLITGEAAVPSERARLANETGAAACITIELTAGDRAGAGGPACSYFGTRTTHSPTGLVLAQLILEELEAEMALPGRIQPLTIATLRETRMPAVQVEPLTADTDRARELLADERFPARVGRAIAAGVRRFFAV